MKLPGRVLFIGCGSVSQCTLPLFAKDLGIPMSSVTVLDMVDNRARIADVLAQGATYVIGQVTPENLGSILGSFVSAGDLIVDLAWNIEATDILQWCRDHGVRYVNTSVELWDPYAGVETMHPLERTLYVRQMALRRMINRWGDNTGPTACVDHGANPGLVSHFTRQALTEIGERVLRDDLAGYRRPVIEHALAERQFNLLAEAVGLKVVHISERDTQITNVPKEVNEFVNTWSVEGFYEEGTAPAEMGWGTHERRMPDGAYRHHDDGPCNQICLPQMGIKTWVRSWVPCGEITGMVVRHGEAFSISDHLTVWDENGHARYRPTVHYAYCPADVAINSLHELEMRNFDLQARQRILEDHEIVSGRDEMGVLLMGHDFKAWWCGSLLSIDETRAIVPGQNATTLQVAASVIAATAWMCDNPQAGLRIPDELPWDYILGRARPYLGTCFSEAVDWDPLSTRNHFFSNYEQRFLDPSDPWQFVNFQL